MIVFDPIEFDDTETHEIFDIDPGYVCAYEGFVIIISIGDNDEPDELFIYEIIS